MGEPVGKQSINGVLSCWFDDSAEEHAPAVPATYVPPMPAAAAAPQPAQFTQPVLHAVSNHVSQPAGTPPAAYDVAAYAQPAGVAGVIGVTTSQQAASTFFDLMEAINDKHVLPDLFVPNRDAAMTATLMQPEEVVQETFVARSQPRLSVQELITTICQSYDSPLYQWMQRTQLADEFDHRMHSVEQRWSPDGTFCAVRRTMNGFTHTIVLKENNSKSTQRVTAPDGTVLMQITSSGNLIEGSSGQRPALMTA